MPRQGHVQIIANCRPPCFPARAPGVREHRCELRPWAQVVAGGDRMHARIFTRVDFARQHGLPGPLGAPVRFLACQQGLPATCAGAFKRAHQLSSRFAKPAVVCRPAGAISGRSDACGAAARRRGVLIESTICAREIALGPGAPRVTHCSCSAAKRLNSVRHLQTWCAPHDARPAPDVWAASPSELDRCQQCRWA